MIQIIFLMCVIFGILLFTIGLFYKSYTGIDGFVMCFVGGVILIIGVYGIFCYNGTTQTISNGNFFYESVPRFATPTKECYYNGVTINEGETLVKCFGVRKDCLVEKLDLKNGLVYCKGKIINMSE
jgi:hypothetical protein